MEKVGYTKLGTKKNLVFEEGFGEKITVVNHYSEKKGGALDGGNGYWTQRFFGTFFFKLVSKGQGFQRMGRHLHLGVPRKGGS